MAIALFITEQYIKDTSYIDENVDMKLLRDVIELAQEKYILPLLGTGLYNQIAAQIVAGSVSAANTTLLDSYIQKALKWWTLYEALDILTFKFTNKSVVKKNSENSQSVNTDELNRLFDSFGNNAEMYSERLTKYLVENVSTFTLYSNPGTGSDTIHPKKSSYRTSIYLGDDGCCNKSLSDRFQGNIDSCCD